MAAKIKCPRCGAENYSTDTVCLECGTSLRQQQPPKPQQGPPKEAAAVPKAATKTPDESPAKKAMPLVWRVVLVSVVAALIEVAIGRPTSICFIPTEPMGLILTIVVGTVLYGGLRGAVLHFVLHFTKWPAGLAALIGGAMGFGLLPGPLNFLHLVVGLVIGYAVGVMEESER